MSMPRRTGRWLGMVLVGFLLAGCAPGPAGSDRLPGRLYFLNGQELTVLARGWKRTVALPGGLSELEFSPDGLHLTALSAGRPVLIRLDGGEPVEVARLEARTAARWSPDGTRLAAMDRGHLRLFDLTGRLLQELPVASGERERVFWAPDGRTVAVEVGPPLVNDKELWLVDLETGRTEPLGKGTFGPLWSPDGRRLAYHKMPGTSGEVRLRSGGEEMILLSQETLGPDFAHLFERNGLSPYAAQWSPGGDRFLIGFKAAGPDPRFAVVIVPVDGSAPTVRILPRFPDHPGNTGMYPPRPCYAGGPTWAAAGQQVVFTLRGPGCDGQLHVADAGSLRSTRELAVDPSARVLMSPDGSWMAATEKDGAVRFISLGAGKSEFELKGLGEPIRWIRPGRSG